MRVVYRIAPAKHARDLSGEGARLSGGRWNNKNTAVIYTSESRSLAALEYLVHVALSDMPTGIKIVSIGIPKPMLPKQIDPSHLPDDWRTGPPPYALADMGTKWAVSGESLLLRVPSVVVAHEFNIIINPLHPDMKSIRILEVEDFIYDERLYRAEK
jgi:RES domain-containing protein